MNDTAPPPPRLLTPYAWAKEAGCSHTAVGNRITSGDLPIIIQHKPDGTPQRYINATLYPPFSNPVGRPKRARKV